MRLLPAVALVLNLVVCLWAFYKGFHIEPTDAAIEEAAQGQRMSFLAVPGLVIAIVGLVRGRWALTCGALSVLLALGATVIALV